MRGRVLLWGVKKVIKQCQSLNHYTDIIAKKIVKHPSIKTLKKATAIGSNEMMSILEDITKNETDMEFKKVLETALANNVPAEYLDYAKDLRQEFERLFPGEDSKLQAAVSTLNKQVGKVRSEIGVWFDTVMSRTTDLFIIWTRVFTAIFAVLLSIWFHIDSIQLLKDLSLDPALRASLIQMSDSALARAEGIVGGETVAEIALKATIEQRPGHNIELPTQIKTEKEGLAWLQVTFKDDPKLLDLLKIYAQQFQETTKRKLKEFANNALELKTELEKSQLSFLTLRELSLNPVKNYDSFLEWVGVLISAALLSLGAPFWYNLLRNLSTLRPVLAGKVDPSKE